MPPDNKRGVKHGVSFAGSAIVATAIAGILVLFLLAKVACRPDPALARNIEAVLAEDQACGSRHHVDPPNDNSRVSVFVDALAREKSKYVSEMSVVVSRVKLPPDFKKAFLLHLSAHDEMSRRLANHPYMPASADDVFVIGLLATLAGEDVDVVGNLNLWQASLQDADLEIQRTWGQVRTTAIRNGACWKPEWD